MKFRLVLTVCMLAVLLVPMAWGDHIVLKNGQGYSGKFIRGDANVVEFRILSRTETFKTADVAQIIFQEPALGTAAAAPAVMAAPAAQPSAPPPPVPQAIPVASSAPPVTQQNPALVSGAGTVVAPVGTAIVIRTTDAIDTESNRVGDTFETTLEDPLVINGQTVAAKGTLVRGRITTVKESGKLTGQAQLGLELTTLVLNGRSYPLQTADYAEVGASRTQRTAATVGGTAALGAIIGAIAGGGKGAAVGAASGAAVGTGVQVMTKGQTLKIPAETILEFKLDAPLAIDLR
jgi:hypothetical protein